MKYSVPFLTAIAFLMTSLTATELAPSTNSYLTPADRAHLRKIVEPGFKLNDVSALYYAILGYKLLGEAFPDKQEICTFLTKTIKSENNMTAEQAFYVAYIWRTVQTCQDPALSVVEKVLTGIVEKDSSTVSELYYAVSGLTALSEKLSREKIDKVTRTIQSTLRKDDNLWNLGYTFHIASDLGIAGAFAVDRIEDAVVQADEVDGQYLQFEGGLSITSFLVNGMFKLSSTLKKKAPLTFQQRIKMANYLLSRRSVQTPKGAANLLSALTILATSEYERPVSVTLADEAVGISTEQPLITVKVCDILGNPVPAINKVIANSASRVGDDATVLSKEQLRQSPTDKTLFTMNFMDIRPERGFYKISVSAGTITNTVTVKVLCDVALDYLDIGTGDADQTTQPKLTRVAYPEKLVQKIEADFQQKLVMRFLLRDGSSKKPMRTHQAFVRLSSVSNSNVGKRGHEIIFVAEPDNSHVYKFEMPVNSAAVNFGHQSGDYNVELIVGDAVLNNPFHWTVATVSLKFPELTVGEAAGKNTSYKQRANIYTTKPEIRHMFREPEKRPPAFVSNLFSGLCLSPILLLLVLWTKLGVNISNFPFSISAVVFHLGLGSIFILFGVFWLKLNMFVTLRYLLGLGVVTFLAGNKMLSRIAHKHKSSR